tara:strand:+ start:553 stop:729 length:177 start_codon:yes stop_codon:yes gene_type:complete
VSILTKTSGNWIINDALYELIESVTIVSYRDDAIVEGPFPDPEVMRALHKERFPEQYL